jgi:nucleotide-binding universal stress UspA family protein
MVVANMKVLVCFDGSPLMIEGVKCAVSALRRDIDYTLLYVLTEHGIYESYKRIFREDLERIEALVGDVDSEKKAARRIFLDPLCAYMREQGFTVRAVVREGHAAAEILDEVSEGHYDIVMLGDARSFSASRLFVGSTVSRVMQNARTCVMVIRPARVHIAEQNRDY